MLDEIKQLLPFLPTGYNIRYAVAGSVVGGAKIEGRYRTVRDEIPDDILAQHFTGHHSIGVQPIIAPGNICKWGCIDVDSYGPDTVSDVTSRLHAFKIPAYVEESKSKGAHIYVCLRDPVIAHHMRRVLKRIASWIGHPDAEIFPGSDHIRASEGDLGRLITYPGYNKGLEATLQAIQASTISVEDLNNALDEHQFQDAPCCLFPLVRQNQADGWTHRNLFLYQYAVWQKYQFPGEWDTNVRNFNSSEINPSLEEREVEALIQQLHKTATAHYKCSGEPFERVCNRGACQVRKFGVASRTGVNSLVSATGITAINTEPVTWFVTVEHPGSGETTRLKLSTSQLLSAAQFKKACMESIKIIPTLPKQKEWEGYISELLHEVEIIPVPFAMTNDAQILDHLYRFCLHSRKSSDPEDILKGRVIVHETTEGFTANFRMVDFMDFRQRFGLGAISPKDLFISLSELCSRDYLETSVIRVEPLEVPVYQMDIKSQYLKIKTEMDLEDEDS